MGLKDLCEQLGVEYSISVNEDGEIRSVSIESTETATLWTYRSGTSTFQELFKEVYGGIIQDIVLKDNPFFLDIPKK